MNFLRPRYLTALDIGSSKISCLIAKTASDGTFSIVGQGCTASAGVKNGVIDDKEKAYSAIKDAVLMAERQSDIQIENVIVNVSSPQMKSTYATAELSITDNRAITSSDIKKLIDTATESVSLEGMEVLHKLPVSYKIDEREDVSNPVGLHGEKISVKLLIVSVPFSQIQDLNAVLERANLNVMARVATPYASACSVLTDDEKQVGTTLLDMGGGTISVALFGNGFLKYAGMLPIGASLITQDIAQVLKTPYANAEWLKTMEGNAFLSPKDTKEKISFVLAGSHAETKIPRSHLISVIIPRIEEILGFTRSFLREMDNGAHETEKIVLCGGGSILKGMQEKSSQILRAQIRLSKPMLPQGVDENENSNWTTFSTCMGLLIYTMNKRIQLESGKQKLFNNGLLARILKWLIQNF